MPQTHALVRAAPSDTAEAIVDVVNANGQTGLAGAVDKAALAGHGHTDGTTSTVRRDPSHMVIYFGPGQRTPASSLSALLDGVHTEAEPAVAAGHLRLVLGTDSTLPPTLTAATGSTCPSGFTADATTAASPPSAAGLSAISGGGIPCVG
jgi:hypothetical protein